MKRNITTDNYKLYTRIISDSKNLKEELRRNQKLAGGEMFCSKNIDLVSQYLVTMETYTMKDQKRLRVKEFPPNHAWFNTKPLTFGKELRNKLVLIDFWTYCCINCLHVLPDIEYLEKKFEGENSLAFVGCHSAKFTNEKGSEKVRDAVLKYDVKHAVINDDKMMVWRNFERRSWPGLVIVSPRTVPIFIINGEGHREILDIFLSVAYDFYYDRLNHEPTIQWDLESVKASDAKKEIVGAGTEVISAMNSNLKYPGKVLCIEKADGLEQNFLVIADTGNNRLIVVDEDTYECLDVIGNGKVGLIDGNYDEAQFHHPQGMCHIYRDGTHFLYLCDTKNHSIREINLKTKEVLTVTGTGEKGFDREGNKDPEVQKLSSPWDVVAINKETILIAMAGVHQIWALNLKTNRCFNFSGNGKEGNLNHKSDIKLCEWSQPSGLSLGVISSARVELFVADSESSTIRSINMKTLKSSRNVVGGDPNPKNLHAYGDEDGPGTNAKLQHPLGVHFIPEKNVVIVADTYNHKIKVIDPFRNEAFTWMGSGKSQLKDENTYESAFNEPSGISSLYKKSEGDVRVYIADCNNHCIRTVLYDTGEVKTVALKGVPEQGKEEDTGKETGMTSKSGANEEEEDMELECDGNQCYPKFF